MGAITEVKGKNGISYKATAISNGQRRYKTFKGTRAKTRADIWIKETERELAEGQNPSTATQRRTPLSAVIEAYSTKVLPSHAKTSQPKERAVLRRIEKHFGGDMPFLTITGEVLADWVDNMRKNKFADGTIDKALRQFQWLIRAARIELKLTHAIDPHTHCLEILRHRGVPLDCAKRTRRINKTDTGSELDQLINYEHPGDTIISKVIQFAVETGMRRGEIAALNWPDIDLKNRVATIRQSKTDKQTGKKGREVPLSTKAIEVLISVRQNNDLSIFGMVPDAISHAFTRTCKRIGIKGLHFHDLRHEAVTRLLEAGFTPAEVGTITGQSLSIVMRYTHFRAEDLAAKMAKMEGSISEGKVNER